ncbi:2-amino-4-hydroxy-6-hydroxymethyldihydropteridine diphosphokinase [Pedobacter alpinus]|uniref:2-amino-4-hydroxy-6-hydroxymethyldihydropteridine pyrophosphokinase n=1 Tax=Pedobacter alpinus TaxID=1590643 RepID=A0ABW5TVC9_9SPHI
MNKVFLLLGGNLGNRFENLSNALKAIRLNVGKIELESSIYETKAWGKLEQPDFLNIAIKVDTFLSPHEVLNEIQKIETQLGRIRKDKWSERTMDIDIIFYNDLILSDSDILIIPHLMLTMRKFVLLPLNEIAPNYKHPITKKTISELLIDCEDKLEVIRLNKNFHISINE